MLDKIAARAPVVANRVQNTLSSVYSWALSLRAWSDQSGDADCASATTRSPRSACSSDDEIRALWRATGAMAPAFRDVLRLVLLTGQRPGECAGIRAEEVDLERELWVLPPERVKNKRRHLVPLVGEALCIVRRLGEGGRHGAADHDAARPYSDEPRHVAKAFERLRNDGVFETPATPHDLRRTAATLMGRLDIDQMTIARVLNHASTTKATVTGSTYDRHTYEPQMRRALEALDGEISRIVTGEATAPNIVALTRTRNARWARV